MNVLVTHRLAVQPRRGQWVGHCLLLPRVACRRHLGSVMARRWVVMGTLLGVLGASTPASGSASVEATVGGSWVNAVPCVFTSYAVEAGQFTCTGSSVWLGAWA